MTILGIDPGLGVTGWAILRRQDRHISLISCGKIVPRAKDPTEKRLALIHTQLKDILLQYSPQGVALEKAFVYKNPLSALTLGQVRGVVMATACLQQAPVTEYAPTLVKQSFTGNGHAPKQQMMAMVHHLFGIQVTADTADAIALAFCHCSKAEFVSKVG